MTATGRVSYRSWVSRLAAGAALHWWKKRVQRGAPPGVPLDVWRIVPEGVKQWWTYRILRGAEGLAWKEVQRDAVLGPLVDSEPDSFSVSSSTMLFLRHLMQRERPRRIVEFGGGVSTRIFADYARQMRAAGERIRVISIDHEAEYLAQTHRALRRRSLEGFVEFLHCPLSRQELLGRELPAYTVEASTLANAAGDEGFGLCFVDGPPGVVGRAGCLPLAAPFLARRATVLLDDACRAGEQQIVWEWYRHFRGFLGRPRLLIGDRHGLAQMRCHRGPAGSANRRSRSCEGAPGNAS